MRVISRKALGEFSARHRAARGPLDDWFNEVARADWASHHDVKAQYTSASIVSNCVVFNVGGNVFNVGGNKYRLVTWINYRAHLVLVKGVFTHRAYDEATIDFPPSS